MNNAREYLAEGYKETIIFYKSIDPAGETSITYEIKNGEIIKETSVYLALSAKEPQKIIASANAKLARFEKKLVNDLKKKKALEKRKEQIKAAEQKRKKIEAKAQERKRKLEAVLDAQRTSNYWVSKSGELSAEWQRMKAKLGCHNDLICLEGFISASGIKNLFVISKEDKKVLDNALKQGRITKGKGATLEKFLK